MNGPKLFALVFAGVLLANLTTFALVRLWDRPPGADLLGSLRAPATSIPVPASISAPPPAAMSPQATLAVAFKNAANGPKNHLSCSMAEGEEYKPLVSLEPGGLKGFNALPQQARIRCQIQIDESSSTMLTYFVIKTAGTYELSLNHVPCSSCANRDWRWATIVTDPSGNSDYTHFK